MILRNLFPQQKTKALTLSYDDGILQDERLCALLRKNGIKATFNLNSGSMAEGSTFSKNGLLIERLPPERVAEVYEGFEIAVHGVRHAYPSAIPADCLPGEIYEDRRALEALAGYPVQGMAYAYGEYNRRVMETLRCLGIVYARTVRSTHSFRQPEDFLSWNPTCHHADPELPALCDRFLEGNRLGHCPIFYLWGHSYEFDVDRNWEIIESFCERMAGKDDIWYATNIEIYRYLQALDSLVSSCDGKMLYNPSAIAVSVTADGVPLTVGPGELCRL
ncbi:MAG: polysaccharide deacetylase family protein [Provencibacterium sp.]|jgi:hypothetical protein|nr:polysaccharide deacetylase family protein [Provencibacterium sp.]